MEPEKGAPGNAGGLDGRTGVLPPGDRAGRELVLRPRLAHEMPPCGEHRVVAGGERAVSSLPIEVGADFTARDRSTSTGARAGESRRGRLRVAGEENVPLDSDNFGLRLTSAVTPRMGTPQALRTWLNVFRCWHRCG